MRLADGRYRCPRCEQAHDVADMTRDRNTCRPCARAKCRAHHEARRAERIARGERVRAVNSPVPADFARRRVGASNAALAETYAVSTHVIRRWLRETDAMPTRGAMPQDFARLAAGLTGPQVAKRWGVGIQKAYRWLRAVRPARTGVGRIARPIPDDWAEQCATRTVTELLQRYGTHRNVMARWVRVSGIAPQPSRRGPAVQLRETPVTPPPRPEEPSARTAAAPVQVHTNGCRDCTPQRLCRTHQTAQLNADIEAWLAAGNAPREVPQGASGLQWGYTRPAA